MLPKCSVCEREIADWSGNVMVSYEDYKAGNISDVRVFCKPCTKDYDNRGIGDHWHNLWELIWIKENTIHYLGRILANLVDEQPTWIWRKPAVEEVYALAAMAHPELSQGSIDQWLSETNQD